MAFTTDESAFWTRLLIDKPRSRTEVDRLVIQVQFWRAAVAGLLIGLFVGGAALRVWGPTPGQRYQIRILWEAVAIEPASAPAAPLLPPVPTALPGRVATELRP